MAPDVTEFEEIADSDELRKALERTQQQLAASKAKAEALVAAVYVAATDAYLAVGPAPAVPKPVKDKRTKRHEVAILPVSDWHVGKQTDSFNSKVAAKRVDMLADKVVEMTDIERSDHPVPECHVMLTGDFIDGVMIFPGQAFEIDSTLFAQMFTAAGILESMLRRLLATFERVVVWEQTGNHGRIGKRGEMPRGDNTDRMMYRIVKERFADESRIVWHERERWYTIVEIGQYRSLLVHGDQIKSFGGTPVFAILKKCNSWASGVLPPFRDVWMGHFHTDLKLSLSNGRGRVFVSPSIESDSAYAAEVVAAAGVPSQRFCCVDPRKARVTSERLLWLD